MQCAEIDVNATPSDFSVNYYIRLGEHMLNYLLSLTIVAHLHTGIFELTMLLIKMMNTLP